MKILLAQHKAAAIYLAILGNKADTSTLNFFGYQVATGKLKTDTMADNLIATPDGQNRYQNLSNNEKINYIYNNITGSQPDPDTLTKWVTQLEQGATLGSIADGIIRQLESYSGTDATTLAQQSFLEQNVSTTLFPSLKQPAELTASAADIQAVYYITGGAVVAEGVNFWASYLHNNPDKLAYVAQKFVEGRPAVASLTNEDFIRTLFQNTFKQAATPEDIAHYIAGLENNSETRGDVVAKMLNDIRNDTTHPAAKELFDQATHVYAAGEMPALAYQETVAAFYFTLARSSVTADALDTWSKKLASGTSEAELLKILSATPEFSTAGNYGDIYQRLYGERLTANESQAILLKAGNDKFQATSLIIDAFRHGEYPLEGHNTPVNPSQVIIYEREVGLALNYATGAATLEITASGGNPFGTVNSGKMHQLSNAELSQLTKITLNANVEQSVDLSFNKIREITLTGDYATSSALLGYLNKQGRDITLILNNTSFQHLGTSANLGEGNIKVRVGADVDIVNANTQLLFSASTEPPKTYGLYWDGNGQNNGANQVSATFTAQNIPWDARAHISANFITKDIFLTTQSDGSVSGKIQSNYEQFYGFQYIDLTHYKGTGSIYLNGELVATEGAKVFDFGVSNQTAGIHNAQYANVKSLTQAAASIANHTGEYGFNISDYSGEIHVLNIAPRVVSDISGDLIVNGNLTSASKIYLDFNVSAASTQKFSLRLETGELKALNAGTVDIAAKGNYAGVLTISTVGSLTEKTLTLFGADNHIQKVELAAYGADQPQKADTLNLTISHDFSDSLRYISGTSNNMHGQSFTTLNINAEKGGSGGGSFFDVLSSLTNGAPFSAITAELAGEQLNVGNVPGSNAYYTANVQINHATVQGNTTLQNATDLNFTDSRIDSLVSLLTIADKTQIHAGTGDQQWTFSAAGDKTMQIYGSVTKPAEVNTLFGGIDMTGVTTADTLFGKLLAQVTHGTSQGQLAEVGALKLDHAVYVIIDKNHNQSFDAQDIVFSLGNQQSEVDIYQAVAGLHYQSPEVKLVGSAVAHDGVFA